VEIRNEDARIVAVLAADDFSTGKRIDSAQASAETQGAVNPTRAIVISGREGIRQNSAFGDPPEQSRRIKTVSILLVLSPLRMSAERKQTPQVVESLRSRWIVWRVPA
jgi:hypothetical protein